MDCTNCWNAPCAAPASVPAANVALLKAKNTSVAFPTPRPAATNRCTPAAPSCSGVGRPLSFLASVSVDFDASSAVAPIACSTRGNATRVSIRVIAVPIFLATNTPAAAAPAARAAKPTFAAPPIIPPILPEKPLPKEPALCCPL